MKKLGKRHRRGGAVRGLTIVPLTLLVAACLAFWAQPASAVTRAYSGTSFGPDGTSGSSFERPGAIAVDPSDGTVYVADTGAGAVYRFAASGAPSNFSGLGANKLGGFSFIASEPGTSEMAVDPAAEVLYVADIGARKVKAFTTAGKPSEFTTTGTNEIGEGEVCGVAVDAGGDVYVGTYDGGVSVYEPTGAPLTSFAAAEACNLVVDEEGAVYVGYFPGAGGRKGVVEKFVPSAFPVTPATQYSSAGVIVPTKTFGLSRDPAADTLYANQGSAVFIYSGKGRQIGRFGERGPGALSSSEGVAVGAESAYASAPESGQVEIFGPLEAEGPRVAAAGVIAVDTTSATVRAEIGSGDDPGSYQVEYGPADCAVSACTVGASGPLGAGGTETVTAKLTGLQPGATYHFRVVATTAAGSAASEDSTFRTFAAAAQSAFALPDGRGYELVSGDAPAGAEVGTPSSAGGLVLSNPKPQRAAADGNSVSYRSFIAYADPSGSPGASQYVSRRAGTGWATENISVSDATSHLSDPVRGLGPDLGFAGLVNIGPPLAPGASSTTQNLYLRNNTTGALTAITPSEPQGSNGEFCVTYVTATEDGSRVFFGANGALAPGAPEPAEEKAMNMYEWSAAGGIRLVNVAPGTGGEAPVRLSKEGGFANGNYDCNGPDAATLLRRAISSDGSHVVWTAAPGPGGQSRALYSRVDGTRSIELDAAAPGAAESGGGIFGDASADGSRVFFYDSTAIAPGATAGDLYRYEIGPERLTDLTTPVNEGEATHVLGVLGADEAGTAVYFVAEGDLSGSGANPFGATARSGEPNLYRWAEGSGVRFIATLNGTLGFNDSPDWADETSSVLRENTTAAVTPDGGAIAFISQNRLTGYDNEIAGAPACSTDSVGRPRGGRGCTEVYLYDAAANSLVCASCNPTGAPPVTVGAETGLSSGRLSTLPPWATSYEPSRYLSPDGSRLFFESFESLLPRDTNGKLDTYEFERLGTGSCTAASEGFNPESDGCISLISGGVADTDSYFLDSSTSGADVFIATRQRLVGADGDENYDVYDARVGGGFPEPPSAAAPCGSEGACRGAAGGPPAEATPASSVPSGKGNVPRRACPKARRVRRRGKTICRAKQRPKHHRAHKRHHRKRTSKHGRKGASR